MFQKDITVLSGENVLHPCEITGSSLVGIGALAAGVGWVEVGNTLRLLLQDWYKPLMAAFWATTDGEKDKYRSGDSESILDCAAWRLVVTAGDILRDAQVMRVKKLW